MQIIHDRRALHRIPELELNLPKTMAYLANAMKGLKCALFSPIPSSLCAFFDFGADHSIAFRADCDALPIHEKNEFSHISTHPGCMHACGHDGHMAIALELARRLNRMEQLPHNVLILFQPGEESPGGAEPLCKSGVLEQYQVKAVFGLHLWPGLESGAVFSREKELMSRSCEVNVDIYGRSAHIAKAKEGLDAVMAGCEFYRRAMEMEKNLPAEIFRLLKFGKFHSGTARNALSHHTHMEGSLRAFQDDVFEQLRSGLYRIGREIEAETGCAVKISMSSGYPAILNPAELCRRVKLAADYEELDEPSMTSEDFSWYQKYVPGMFFFLGLGDVPALHTDNFDFDETILLKGADFFQKIAENFQ